VTAWSNQATILGQEETPVIARLLSRLSLTRQMGGCQIAVLCHMAGCGRTTTAAALAWCWGQTGHTVKLIDADPAHDLGLIVLRNNSCPWANVEYSQTLTPASPESASEQLVLIDCPPITDPAIFEILRQVQGVLFICPPNPVTLRTISVTADALKTVREVNPNVELLGVVVGIYNEYDPTHSAMLDRLRQVHGKLLLEPPVPDDPAVRAWPLDPGSELPVGAGRDAYLALSKAIRDQAERVAAR